MGAGLGRMTNVYIYIYNIYIILHAVCLCVHEQPQLPALIPVARVRRSTSDPSVPTMELFILAMVAMLLTGMLTGLVIGWCVCWRPCEHRQVNPKRKDSPPPSSVCSEEASETETFRVGPIFVSEHGERFHYDPKCCGLRHSRKVIKKTICQVCEKELKSRTSHSSAKRVR